MAETLQTLGICVGSLALLIIALSVFMIAGDLTQILNIISMFIPIEITDEEFPEEEEDEEETPEEAPKEPAGKKRRGKVH